MAWWDRRARENQRAKQDASVQAGDDIDDTIDMPPNADNATGGISLTPDAQALLAACGNAGITTATAFNALVTEAATLRPKGAAFDARMKTLRETAGKRIVALYPEGESRTGQEAFLTALPDGTALEHQAATLDAAYDARFGTTGTQGAARRTLATHVATPAAVAQDANGENDDRAELKAIAARTRRQQPAGKGNGN